MNLAVEDGGRNDLNSGAQLDCNYILEESLESEKNLRENEQSYDDRN
jgi:hypothetical protein